MKRMWDNFTKRRREEGSKQAPPIETRSLTQASMTRLLAYDIDFSLYKRRNRGIEPKLYPEKPSDFLISTQKHLGLLAHVFAKNILKIFNERTHSIYLETTVLPLSLLPKSQELLLPFEPSDSSVDVFHRRVLEIYSEQINTIFEKLLEILSLTETSGFDAVSDAASKYHDNDMYKQFLHLINLEYNPNDPNQIIIGHMIIAAALRKLKETIDIDKQSITPQHDVSGGNAIFIAPAVGGHYWIDNLFTPGAFKPQIKDESLLRFATTAASKPWVIAVDELATATVQTTNFRDIISFFTQISETAKQRPLFHFPALILIRPARFDNQLREVANEQDKYKSVVRVAMSDLSYENWQSLYMPTGTPTNLSQKLFTIGQGNHTFSMISAGVIHTHEKIITAATSRKTEQTNQVPAVILRDILLNWIVNLNPDFEHKTNMELPAFGITLQYLLEIAKHADENGSVDPNWINLVFPHGRYDDSTALEMTQLLRSTLYKIIQIPDVKTTEEIRTSNAAKIDITTLRILREMLNIGYVSNMQNRRILNPEAIIIMVCGACGSGVKHNEKNCSNCGIGAADFIFKEVAKSN